MGTAIKIGLGIFIGGILLIGACGLLVAAGTNLEEPSDTGLEDTGGDTGGSGEPARTPQRTRRFSGNGSKNIGTIKVTDDAVLSWRNSGDETGGRLFVVMDEEGKINVNSQGRKGRSALEPGTYRNVDVTAFGNWSMTIKGR